MPKQNDTTKERQFTVHTVGGEKLYPKGSSINIDEEKSRVYILDANGQDKEEWIIFLTGIAAIETKMGKVTFGHFRM